MVISSVLFALPCNTISAGSTPAFSAVRISPPPATSSPRPSCDHHPLDRGAGKSLGREHHSRIRPPCGQFAAVLAGPVPQGVLGHHQRRACRTRRRGRRPGNRRWSASRRGRRRYRAGTAPAAAQPASGSAPSLRWLGLHRLGQLSGDRGRDDDHRHRRVPDDLDRARTRGTPWPGDRPGDDPTTRISPASQSTSSMASPQLLPVAIAVVGAAGQQVRGRPGAQRPSACSACTCSRHCCRTSSSACSPTSGGYMVRPRTPKVTIRSGQPIRTLICAVAVSRSASSSVPANEQVSRPRRGALRRRGSRAARSRSAPRRNAAAASRSTRR